MLDQLKEKCIRIFDSKSEPWRVAASSAAKNTKNYIRDIVENLGLQPNPQKPVISLSIGDPTIYGNLKTSAEAIEELVRIVREVNHNGYAPSVGHEDSRKAVAEYLSRDKAKFEFQDIILCSGCSSSIDLCINVLADASKNHNILIPRPGFPLYRTLAESVGIKVKYYNLLPEKDWEIDLHHLEQQIDNNTAAIILNNPSNPCGSVYSEDHLRDFLEIANRRQIPVIADEIYEQIVFPGQKFVSTAALNSKVPILICGGLAKRFLVPGWRLGWIAIHDEIGAYEQEVRRGLVSLSQKILGCNSLIQGAIPRIFQNTPQSFHDYLINTLVENATLAYKELSTAKGLIPYQAQGTMYMMVEITLHKFPWAKDGLEFSQRLMEEESVFCLPGECFEIPGFMRIILTVPHDLMKEACERMVEFCNRHYTD